jgi:hypothetical protein
MERDLVVIMAALALSGAWSGFLTHQAKAAVALWRVRRVNRPKSRN